MRQGSRLERVAGIEPATQPWEGRILPLNYTRLEPKVGIEPTTFALRKHCSTTELLRRTIIFYWFGGSIVQTARSRYNNCMQLKGFVSGVGEYLAAVRSSRFARDRLFMTAFMLAVALVVLMWGVILIRVRPASFPVPVHYTTLGGFDALGSWYQPILASLYATVLVLVNVALSYISYQRSRMASFFLLAGAVVVALFSLIITNAFSSLI